VPPHGPMWLGKDFTTFFTSAMEQDSSGSHVVHCCQSSGVEHTASFITFGGVLYIQYKFINMAAISWIKRKTITHKQRHASVGDTFA